MDSSAPDSRFARLADALATNVRELAALGWTPATSSNCSVRIDAESFAITVSGRDKGRLSRDDVMRIDGAGQSLDDDRRPSAETALHTQIYRRFPATGAVLHTHSHNQSVASRLYADAGVLRLQGWELEKAITGIDSHEHALELPVFPNSQQMGDITARVDAWIDTEKPLYAYLIAGHGIYTWGSNLAEARRHLEALEFLIACELDLRRLSR